jgi:hypothetical protein
MIRWAGARETGRISPDRPREEHEWIVPRSSWRPARPPFPPEVLLAQGSPLVYHRGPGFGR